MVVTKPGHVDGLDRRQPGVGHRELDRTGIEDRAAQADYQKVADLPLDLPVESGQLGGIGGREEQALAGFGHLLDGGRLKLRRLQSHPEHPDRVAGVVDRGQDIVGGCGC